MIVVEINARKLLIVGVMLRGKGNLIKWMEALDAARAAVDIVGWDWHSSHGYLGTGVVGRHQAKRGLQANLEMSRR